MGNKRKYYSGEEKVKILRRHLIDGVAVSDLCDECGLNPNVTDSENRLLPVAEGLFRERICCLRSSAERA